CDSLDAGRLLVIPQLEIAAPGFVPVGIEVNEVIQSPVDLESLVEVEIGVHAEHAAAPDFVEPSPAQMWVCDQFADARQPLEERQDRARVELKNQLAGLGPEVEHVFG